MSIEPVKPGVKLVVLATPGDLARLGPELPAGCGDIELRDKAGFLRDLGKDTQEEEEIYRQMTTLYASLRGKVVVRLICVNLNPEVRSKSPPLEGVIQEWRKIDENRSELLKEEQRTGIRFVTVLVAEEGDWLVDDQGHLDTLAGRGTIDEPIRAEAGMEKQACYLLGRQLELWQGPPLFSIDIWPQMVAGLLQFLVAATRENTKIGLPEDGLHAWRIQRFVLPDHPGQFEIELVATLKKLEEKIIDSKQQQPEPAFSPVAIEASEERLKRDAIDLKREEIFQREWLEVNAYQLGDLLEFKAWGEEREALAIACRASLAYSEDQNDELSRFKSHLNGAAEPAKLRPGPLPEFVTTTEVLAKLLAEVRNRRLEAKRREETLENYLAEHDRASSAYSRTPDLLVVGGAVGIAFGYSIVAAWLALGYLLPFSAFSPWTGAWLAVCGLAGIATYLALSQRLQYWRGEVAAETLLDPGTKQVIDARAAVYESQGKILLEAGAAGRRALHRLAQELLHERLARADRVLRNELQHSWKARDKNLKQFDQQEDQRKSITSQIFMAGYALPPLQEGKYSYRPEEKSLDEKRIKKLFSEFLKDWQDLLAQDERRRGFLPVKRILQIIAELVRHTENEVRKQIDERALESLRNTESDDLNKMLHEAEEVLQLSSNARSYSVDFESRTVPKKEMVVKSDFLEAFEKVWQKTCCKEEDAGVSLAHREVAVWFGTVEIDLDCTDKKIKFRPSAQEH